MKFARIGSSPRTITIAEGDAPDGAATVLAAGINPVDLAIASGKMPFRQVSEGDTLGFEGVARAADGTVRYFSAPEPPAGSFAEQVDLDRAETATVPDGLDPVLAAAIGVPGIAAWASLMGAAGFTAGDRVLVLGGTGSVGRIAAQIALAQGASAVAATARDERGLAEVASLGVTPIDVSTPEVAAEQLAREASDGVDVVVDTLWGAPLVAAIEHLRPRARIAQVGNAAGAEAQLVAPAFRNRGTTMVGHSNFLLTPEQRRTAYEAVADLAVRGRIAVGTSTVDLDGLPEAWAAIADHGLRGKPVLVP